MHWCAVSCYKHRAGGVQNKNKWFQVRMRDVIFIWTEIFKLSTFQLIVFGNSWIVRTLYSCTVQSADSCVQLYREGRATLGVQYCVIRGRDRTCAASWSKRGWRGRRWQDLCKAVCWTRWKCTIRVFNENTRFDFRFMKCSVREKDSITWSLRWWPWLFPLCRQWIGIVVMP